MNPTDPDTGNPSDMPEPIPVARPATTTALYAGQAGVPGGQLGSNRRRWWAPRPMTRLQAFGDLVIIAGILFVPQLAAAVLGMRPRDEEGETVSASRMVIANSLQFGMVAAVAVYLTYRAGQPLSSIGFRRVRFWQMIRRAIAATFTMYASLVAVALIGAAVMRPNYQVMTESMRNIEDRLGVPSWGLILLIAGTAGIFEEIVFRGFLLTRLRVLLGTWTAAIVVGMFVFASLHMWEGAWAVMLILPVGLVLSIAFVRYRSLGAPMLAHFLFNFLQLALMRALYDSPYVRRLMEQQ